MQKLTKLVPALLLELALLVTSTAMAAETEISIGTGKIAGVYYTAGDVICRLVNRDGKQHGIRCSVESTEGSIYNLNAMRAGNLNIGLVQSDSQYHAYHGSNQFKDKGPYNALRAVFALHAEPFTVVARADSGIEHVLDLKGKRINIGPLGSGQRATMGVVMKAFGWDKSDFALVSEFKVAEQSNSLCDGQIDAILFTVGHPSGLVKEATSSCETVIVEIGGPEIDKLVKENPYYRHVTIPAGMYRGNPQDVKTFGVVATLVSSTATPDELVYQVTRSVFENFEDFKMLHPAFATLEKKQMIKESLSAPLHDGAVKYYQEVGFM